MTSFALNHMTVASRDYAGLLELAIASGCGGVELRNDLRTPLFSGDTPEHARNLATEKHLAIHAIAELKDFNRWNAERQHEADSLVQLAKRAGAESIVLIPCNDGGSESPSQRQKNLNESLENLLPPLAQAKINGLIEPLGFATSSLRYKAEAIDAITTIDAADTFKLVHDTFHHKLAGEQQCFAAYTAMVHISGVTENTLALAQLQDCHRVFVDANDRLDNIEQLSQLQAQGYDGVISFECFADEVTRLDNPLPPLQTSMQFIQSRLSA